MLLLVAAAILPTLTFCTSAGVTHIPSFFDCDAANGVPAEWAAFRGYLVEGRRLRALPDEQSQALANDYEQKAVEFAESAVDALKSTAGHYEQAPFLLFNDICTASRNNEMFVANHTHFCLFGTVNALFILSRHVHVTGGNPGYAYRLLQTAAKLLHYARFDFTTSASWPYTSYHVLRNLFWEEDRPDFILEDEPVIAASTAVFTSIIISPERQSNFEMPDRQIHMWLTDTHSSASTEIVDVFTRLLPQHLGDNAKLDVSIHRESLDPRCTARPANMDMCSNDKALRKLLSLSQYDERAATIFHQDIEQLAVQFYDLYKEQLAAVDIFVCSMPAIWCRLYHYFSQNNHNVHVLAWIPQTIMLWVPDELRAAWARQFVQLATSERHMVVFPTQFLSEQVVWQVGVRVPVIRYFGLYFETEWQPAIKDTVLVTHRPSEEVDCVLRQFYYLATATSTTADHVKLEFVSAVRGKHADGLAPFPEFTKFRAVVFWPYDVNTMLLHELFSAAIPLFMPGDFWRWGSRFGELYSTHISFEGELRFGGHPYPPVIYDRAFLNPSPAMHWSAWHEANRLPYSYRFFSISELFHLLNTVTLEELTATSAQMRDFTSRELEKALRAWGGILTGLLAGDTSSLKVGMIESSYFVTA